jgi:hypothetical protein
MLIAASAPARGAVSRAAALYCPESPAQML